MQLNSEFTDWFRIDKGSREGDTLSPTPCYCFLSPLCKKIKGQCINVKFGNLELCLLGYRDNLAIIGDNEHGLQKLLKVTEDWYNRLRLKLNTTKSYVMHFRSDINQLLNLNLH